jgi:hypothetical protein
MYESNGGRAEDDQADHDSVYQEKYSSGLPLAFIAAIG